MIVLPFLTLPTMTLLISRQCTAKTRQAFLDFPHHNIVPPLDIVDLQAVHCSFPDKILTISIQDIDIDIDLGLDIDIVDLQAVYCSFPEKRTQPVSEHKLKKEKDIVGRFLQVLPTLKFTFF